jgi:thiosulfate/3-mercaptopyruvate sulfurtransferase
VLDVRSQKEYSGQEMKKGAQKAGRIPGVTWIEWKEAIVEDGPYKGYWKPAEEIRRIYSSRGVTPEKEVFIYCQSGVRSAHSLVSLYLAGYPPERLHNYDGSWVEWSRTEEPFESGQPSSGA